MDSSAPAMSHALEELVGHVDRLQRSLLFTHFRLEQGPISFIYRPSASRASRNQIDAFIAKRGLLIVLYRPLDWRWGALVSNSQFEFMPSVLSADPRTRM
jgi:hypothetical protein